MKPLKMAAPQKLVEFLQFLDFKYFQNFLGLRHFQFGRDAKGRLINTSWLAFHLCTPVHILYLCLNCTDIVKSLYLGVPNSQNMPMLSIASYFTVRGVMLFMKRNDIMEFLVILDQEFPRDAAAQQRLHVPQVYEKHQRRNRYANYALNGSIVAFSVTPCLVYIVMYEDSNAIITENQQLLGGYLPFGLRQKHMAYPLVYLFDLICTASGCALFSSVDTLFFAMQGQLIMHLDYLNRRIRVIDFGDVSLPGERQLYAHLCQLIRRQQQLNSMFDQFNDIFKAMFMITDFMAATCICFHLYLITETSNSFLIVRYSMPCVALTVFTFENCLRGMQLEEASARLSDALYDQNWYMGSRKIRKLITIWVSYTLVAKTLNAYGLLDINMMHFANIMQIAYKLFTFLKSR
ncbi:hypothetical protein KR222_009028 [Zaprionus bogoriensis]|nr:hypothetical protein KR222_009028 [Zaprionus bogoriensis]